MFAPTELEETEFRLKPMNCPFHIGIYKSHQRSYRDLPLRYAELGTVLSRRTIRNSAWTDAGAWLYAGRRAHFLHARSGAQRDRRLRSTLLSALLDAFGFDKIQV